MYIDLNRIEFQITNACSGNANCSAGTYIGQELDADAAITALSGFIERFKIESVMTRWRTTSHTDMVCKIHAASCDCGILAADYRECWFFS